MDYEILVFRSMLNNFYWELRNNRGKTLATSSGFTRKEMCMKTATKISKDLNCDLEFIDLENDWEE